MKKTIAILLTLAMLFALAACGTTESSSEEEVLAADESAASETETEPAETGSAEEPAESVDPETEPAESESVNAETEPAAEAEPAAAEDDLFTESWKVIQEYGFNENGYSYLSYTLNYAEITDEGDYYSVPAVFAHSITMPDDPEVGETVTVVTNELTGETLDLTYNEDGYYYDEDGQDYYVFSVNGANRLFWFSDDRIDADFFEGELHINKDAQTGVVIIDDFHTFGEEDYTGDSNWFNGLIFDENGNVTTLAYIGD